MDGRKTVTLPIPPFVYWIVGLAIVLRIIALCASGYTSEDFMITLRYAENLAHGHGMVYNVGERVLGTTTPLYTLYLALAEVAHLSPILCGKAVNIAADGAVCLLLFLWLRHEGFELAGSVAALIAAIHPIHLQWAISGMETSLVTAAGLWALYAWARGRSLECYLALGLLFLLRWDSLILTGVITVAFLLRDQRVPLRAICLFVAVITPWLVVAGHYYGSPIPVTGKAKVVVYGWFADHREESALREETTADGRGLTKLVALEPTWLLRRLPRQQKLMNVFFGDSVAFILSTMAVFGAIHIVRHRRWSLVPALLWFLLYMSAFLLSRVLLFNWYMVPPFPVVEMSASIGLVAATDRALRRVPVSVTRAIAAAAAAAGAAASSIVMSQVLRHSQAIETNLRVPLGQWLAIHTNKSDRVLLEPIGYIGYHSRCRVIDPIGLVSPEALPYYGNSSQWPWLSLIRAVRPQWCVLRPGEAFDIKREAIKSGFDWNGTYKLVYVASYRPDADRPPLEFEVYTALLLSDK